MLGHDATVVVRRVSPRSVGRRPSLRGCVTQWRAAARNAIITAIGYDTHIRRDGRHG
jgi:hypothetical protein